MAVSIEVRKLHPWALLPEKQHIDKLPSRDEAALLEANFRYHRKARAKEFCPPWVLGQELGWQLLSPVTIDFSPVDDVQVAADADPAEAGRLLDVTEFWLRGSTFMAAPRNSWIRSFQYRGREGGWEAMFLPNGEGTVEWHLGWAARIPDDYFLMVSSLDDSSGLEIPTGVMTAKQVNRTWDGVGISVAIKPITTHRVTRGEPFARVALVHRDTLQAKLEVLE